MFTHIREFLGSTPEPVPTIVVTRETIDLGDVMADELKTRNFTIENKGRTPVKLQLLSPSTPTAKMFQFCIDKHTVGAGEKANFTVKFQSKMYGEFSETFKLKQEGSNETIPIRFTGRVKGPSYNFDRPEIDFGNVQCSSCQEEHITLENTSAGPFEFTLRVLGEPSEIGEFELFPYKGHLESGEKEDIKVLFTPQREKKYEASLSISILHAGPDLYSIPILAETFGENQHNGHWDPAYI